MVHIFLSAPVASITALLGYLFAIHTWALVSTVTFLVIGYFAFNLLEAMAAYNLQTYGRVGLREELRDYPYAQIDMTKAFKTHLGVILFGSLGWVAGIWAGWLAYVVEAVRNLLT